MMGNGGMMNPGRPYHPRYAGNYSPGHRSWGPQNQIGYFDCNYNGGGDDG
jgi:hypothetical protein